MNYKTIIFLSFCGIFSACSSDNKKDQAASENIETTDNNSLFISNAQFASADMKFGKLADFDFANKVKATGTIDVPPEDQVGVSAYYGGYIKRIQLAPGKYVNQGELLFTIENPAFIQMQQDFLESKGQLEFLKTEYERQQTLEEENIASQKKFLMAKSDYEVTLARYAGLKKKLSLVNINPENITADNLSSTASVYAPISGYITNINASMGKYINPEDEALQITNTNHVIINLNIFEKDFPLIREGQSIYFSLPDAPETQYQAEVLIVGKTIMEDKQMVNVHAHLISKNVSNRLAPGMYIEAQIITSNNLLKALPEQSVVTIDNQSFILEKKSENETGITFTKRKITIGKKSEGMVEVLNYSEFNPKTEILVHGAFNIIQ